MNNGFVVAMGSLTNLDTQIYPVGTQLYLSATSAGAWTSVKQYAPNHLVYVGIVVRSHPTQGVVEIRIQNGYELDELHDVSAQSPTNGDILQYVAATDLWTKAAGTTTNIAEGTNLYFTDTRARAAITLTTTGTSGAATYSGGTLNIPQYQGVLTNPVTGTGTSGQVAYFNGTSSITSNAAFAFTPTSQLLVNNSVTAASAIARGTNLTPTLTAAANNDVLVGLDINPTFTNGAFTGVSNLGLRVQGAARVQGVLTNQNTSDNYSFVLAQSNAINFGFGMFVDTLGNFKLTRLSNGNFDTTLSLLIDSNNLATFRGGIACTTLSASSSVSGTNAAFYRSANTQLSIGVSASFGYDIGRNTSDGLLYFSGTQSGANGYSFGGVNGTRLLIPSTGNILINTTTDAGFRLDVNGTARVTGQITATTVVFGTVAQAFTFGGQAYFGTVGGLGTINLDGAVIRLGNTTNVTVSGISLGQVAQNMLLGGTHTSSSASIQSDILINTTLNFASSGYAYRGIWYNPTITSLGGNRHIAVETATGDVLLCTTSGNVAIGTSTLATATELTLGGSQTASSAIARGGLINTTLVAAANNDVLVGLDINPTFTNGAFTSVRNYAARFNGNISVGTQGQFTSFTESNYVFIGNSTISASNGSTNGDLAINSNFYYNGTNTIYTKNGFATNIFLTSSGRTQFSTAPSGTAGNTATFTQSGLIFNSGNWLLGTGTTDAGFRLDVNGTARLLSCTINGGNSGNTLNVNNGVNFGLSIYGLANTPIIAANSGISIGRYTTSPTQGALTNETMYIDVQNQKACVGNGANLSTTTFSAAFEVRSTSKGFLPPKMNTIEKNAISSPVAGLIIFDNNLGKLCVYSGTTWETITSI
jgi:hypothetical protein